MGPVRPNVTKKVPMKSAIVVHSRFDKMWSFAADHAHARWRDQHGAETVTFLRLDDPDDTRTVGELLTPKAAATTERLLALEVPLKETCLDALPRLREVAFAAPPNQALREKLAARGVRLIEHSSQGFWAQSVAEFGLALTLCGLRRIPQTHQAMTQTHAIWNYQPPGGAGRPGARGQQFGDDPNFANGTIAGKRVRIVGAGNIASRYASYVHLLGADVAAWDPFASEPCFHRTGARREYHLDQLGRDAEIFAPMLPLTDETRGIVAADHINALPRGCLVVLITRAEICDIPALRRRVLADELALAADVFDGEPVPLEDPLLNRHNVVHTPHNAGRTIHSNQQWADTLLDQFAKPA